MKRIIIFIFWAFFYASTNAQTLVVLGTTQDAGKPQIGCQKICCKYLKDRFLVSSLGVTDTKNKKNYLFDATPDITAQFERLSKTNGVNRHIKKIINRWIYIYFIIDTTSSSII